MNAPVTIPPVNVYAKIAAVQGELAKVGIAKNRRNQQGSGYNFRGIDDVYAALSPLLARYALVIVPRVTSREVVERATKNGGALFNVTVHAEFDFVSADDGSIHTAATYGEAMDSADKATNKAMSAAYKYAAFMTFAIPTEGDNDADAVTHEVAAQQAGGTQQEREVSPPPAEMPPAEYAKVVGLIQATGIPMKALLKEYQVQSIKLLSPEQYADAVKRLTAKMGEKAKAQTNAAANGFGELIDDEIPY